MLENINWNFMDSQHKHLPSKPQMLKIKFSYPKQIILIEKASVFLLVFWSIYPIRWDQQWKEKSSEPQSGWRTVLWLWHLLVFEARGCYWHPRTTDRKQNILQRIIFQQRSLRCPLRQCKNKKLLTWASTLFSYTEDLRVIWTYAGNSEKTHYPVLLSAQMSSHHLGGPHVFIWSQLYGHMPSTCLFLMHSGVHMSKHLHIGIQTPYSCPLNYSLMGSEDCHCTQQVTGSTLSLTNLTLKNKR